MAIEKLILKLVAIGLAFVGSAVFAYITMFAAYFMAEGRPNADAVAALAMFGCWAVLFGTSLYFIVKSK